MSITLIIGTLMVYKQLNFMKNQPLGFDKEQKYIIQVRGGASIRENSEEVKDQFLQHPSITGAAASSTVPGRGTSSFAVKLPELEDKRSQDMYHIYFEPNFIQEYDIKILAGRSFQKEMRTDIEGAFLINAAAARALGWDSPEKAIGQLLYTGRGGHVYPIIGVTSDFHYRGLQTKVEPLVMGWLPNTFSNITLTLDADNLPETLKFIEAKWQELFPGYPLEGIFLDTDFERQYRSDEQAGKIFGTFAILGIFIACLGLLGLASFSAEQRTKEIGIRKVLGASVSGIIVLLTKDFMKWVAIATIIAWPASYFIMREWLANFAYRTSLDWIPFFLAAFIAFIIALITVSAQAVRAAQADPATSLKYE
jgi:putative ABC transport system permease protein